MTTPTERLADAYAATPPRTITRHPFQPDAHLERLLTLRATDPTTYQSIIDPTVRTSLGYYEERRAAANYHPKETTDDNHG